MAVDRSFIDLNTASTQRMRAVGQLSDAELRTPVGQHWTVAIVLAHLAFWDRRALYVLDKTEQEGKLFIPEIGIFVNDLNLPFWQALPVREAVRIGLENAEACDRRLEAYPEHLLEAIYTYNRRWVIRALHRNEHLDEADAALKRQF